MAKGDYVYLVYATHADGAQTAIGAFTNMDSAQKHIERARSSPDPDTMSHAEILGITGFRVGVLKVDEY